MIKIFSFLFLLVFDLFSAYPNPACTGSYVFAGDYSNSSTTAQTEVPLSQFCPGSYSAMQIYSRTFTGPSYSCGTNRCYPASIVDLRYNSVASCPSTFERNSATGICECPTGTYRATSVCVSECPAGSFPSPTGICKTCPSPYVYQFNTDSCVDPSSCEDLGQLLKNGSCTDLSPYNGDPSACRAAGGYPLLGLGKGTSTYLQPQILCMNFKDFTGHAASDLLGLMGFFNPYARGAKGILDGIDYLSGIVKNTPSGGTYPKGGNPSATDLKVELPRIKPDGTVEKFPITESPTPPNSNPKADIDAYNGFLRDVYFPAHPEHDPANQPITVAELDRFNKFSETYKSNGADPSYSYSFTPDMGNIWKSTRGASPSSDVYASPYMTSEVSPIKFVEPLQDTYPNLFDGYSFSAPSAPSVYTSVPQTSTVIKTTTSNGIDVTRYSNTKNYPDGSSSLEVVDISETYKKGSHTVTVISPDGVSSTTSTSFDLPNYNPSNASSPDAWGVKQTSPVSSTPVPISITPTDPTISFPVDPATGLPVSPNPDGSSPFPTTPEGQDIINAPMPSYSLPETGEFETYDKNVVSGMITDATNTIDNLKTQYDAAKLIYDNTLNLVENGWDPPEFSPGQCGNSLTLNWHGKQIDLCPPITQNLSTIAPVISLLVTIAGSVIAIGIFIAGF